MSAVTTSGISAGQDAFFNRTMLVRGLPFLVHEQFGQRKPLPMREGKTMRFRRYGALALVTTDLTESVTPVGKTPTKTDISATIKQYGDFIEYSDLLEQTSLEAILTEFAELLGEQGGQSVDAIHRDNVYDSTSEIFSNGASTSAVNTVIDANDLDRTIRLLESNNARMFTSMITATTGVGTSPIAPAFWGIAHPDVAFTLRGVSGWKNAWEYAKAGEAAEGEIGAYKHIRFVMTTQAKIQLDAGGAPGGTVKSNGGSAADVYHMIVVGRDAYGIVPLEGQAFRNIRKAVGSAGTADALDQRGTTGWKATTTSLILNNSFIVQVQTAAAV